jgi:hypothetical protein
VDSVPRLRHRPRVLIARCQFIALLLTLLLSARPLAAAELPNAIPTLDASAARPFVNSLGQRFVRLPGTNVLMCIWETRVQDFQAFLRETAASTTPLPAGLLPTQPACNLNWTEATAFTRWLTRAEQKLGNLGPEDRYRLPTDAEWSLAIGPTRYPWGDKWPPPAAGPQLTGYLPGDGADTAPVGSRPPNALGIHDLGGNVFEWCLDWYERKMNPAEIRIEFKRLDADEGGRTYKFLRGASWAFLDPVNLLTAYRYPVEPQQRGGLYGFRIVLELDGPRPKTPTKNVIPAKAATAMPAKPSAGHVRGRALLSGRCRECHQVFDPVPYDLESWDRIMSSMRGKAKLSPAEAVDLDAYVRTLRTAPHVIGNGSR